MATPRWAASGPAKATVSVGELAGWRSLLGWRPSLLGWRPSLAHCRPSPCLIQRNEPPGPPKGVPAFVGFPWVLRWVEAPSTPTRPLNGSMFKASAVAPAPFGQTFDMLTGVVSSPARFAGFVWLVECCLHVTRSLRWFKAQHRACLSDCQVFQSYGQCKGEERVEESIY